MLMNTTKDSILLVFGRASQKWSPPKGGIEVGETVLQGAVRECLEETGLRVTLSPDVDSTKAFRIRKQHYFSVAATNDVAELLLRPWDVNEVQTIKWWTWKDLEGIPATQCNMIVAELRREETKRRILEEAICANVEAVAPHAPADLGDWD